MRRFFGFVLGTIIGISVFYAIRRWLNSNSAAQLPAQSPTTPTPTTKPDTTETGSKINFAPGATSGRYTVRTNGPRPQAQILEEVKGTEIEPVAAQETDAVAASGRAEMEADQELALNADAMPKEMPAPVTTEQLSQEVPAPAAEEQNSQAISATDTTAQATQTMPAPAATDQLPTDDLAQIRGVGKATAQKLQDAGIYSFAQLADLSYEELERITDFNESRVRRDSILEQAAALAKGEEFSFPVE